MGLPTTHLFKFTHLKSSHRHDLFAQGFRQKQALSFSPCHWHFFRLFGFVFLWTASRWKTCKSGLSCLPLKKKLFIPFSETHNSALEITFQFTKVSLNPGGSRTRTVLPFLFPCCGPTFAAKWFPLNRGVQSVFKVAETLSVECFMSELLSLMDLISSHYFLTRVCVVRRHSQKMLHGNALQSWLLVSSLICCHRVDWKELEEPSVYWMTLCKHCSSKAKCLIWRKVISSSSVITLLLFIH